MRGWEGWSGEIARLIAAMHLAIWKPSVAKLRDFLVWRDPGHLVTLVFWTGRWQHWIGFRVLLNRDRGCHLRRMWLPPFQLLLDFLPGDVGELPVHGVLGIVSVPRPLFLRSVIAAESRDFPLLLLGGSRS